MQPNLCEALNPHSELRVAFIWSIIPCFTARGIDVAISAEVGAAGNLLTPSLGFRDLSADGSLDRR